MAEKQLPKIKTVFSKVLLISALMQIILLAVLISFAQKLYTSNKTQIIKNDLFVLDDITAKEIAKYSLLNNTYAIDLTLMSLQNRSEADEIAFIKSLDRLKFKNCDVNKDTPSICTVGKNTFTGIIPVIVDNINYGFLITKKNYKESFFDESTHTIAILTTFLIIIMIIINYCLILFSVKRYVNDNIKTLMSSVHGEKDFGKFSTKEHYEIARALFIERENNQKLQDRITQQEVDQALKDIVRQVTHNIRSPLSTLQILCKNSEATSSLYHSRQFRAVINDISSLIDNLTIKVKNSTPDDRRHLPRYLNLYSSIYTIVNSKLTEFNDFNCNIKVLTEGVNSESLWIYAAPLNLNSVISNLINNGYEAIIKDEKKIIIKIIELSGNSLEIAIIDNGQGIPYNILDAVQNGLSTKHAGQGIGLSSAIKYIKSIDGELSIKSTVEKGTEVSIKLPTITPPFFVSNIELVETKSLIIVDDEMTVHQYWRKLTKPNNIKTIHFHLPEDFISWYELNASYTSEYSYFIDYYYSNSTITGLDVLKQLKLSDVFLVTNDYDSLSIQEYCIENKVMVIPKPFPLAFNLSTKRR